MANVLYLNEDHTVRWDGATKTVNGTASYLNSATVTYALKDATGTAVSGGTGTLSYISSSNGNYEGTIESTVVTTSNFTEGGTCFLELTLSEGLFNGFRRLVCRVAYRGED